MAAFTLAAVAASVVQMPSAQASTVVTHTSVLVMRDVLGPGENLTASLRGMLPDGAVSATFAVSGVRPGAQSAVYLCSGTTVDTDCLSDPTALATIDSGQTSEVTIPLDRRSDVVIHNTDSQAETKIVLVAYEAPRGATLATVVSGEQVAQQSPKTFEVPRLPDGAQTATFAVAARSDEESDGQVAVCAGSSCSGSQKTVSHDESQTVTLDMSEAKGQVTIDSGEADTEVDMDLVSYTTDTDAGPAVQATPSASPTGGNPAVPPMSATFAPTQSTTHGPLPGEPGAVPPSQNVPAGRPGASNTGVPAGTSLTRHNGNLAITTPNTVIDGMDIYGFVEVKASGVVIRNSRIHGGSTTYDRALIDVQTGVSGTLIQDCELAPDVPSYHIRGVFARESTTLQRLNIHGVIDQVLILGNNVTVKDSWFHDNLVLSSDPNYSNKPSHSDNFQISVGTNITISNNTLTGANNAAIQVTQDRGDVVNMHVTGNYLDNGSCTVNLAEKAYGPLQGFSFSNNVFGRGTTIRDCAIIAPDSTKALLSLSNNRYTPDNTQVSVHRG